MHQKKQIFLCFIKMFLLNRTLAFLHIIASSKGRQQALSYETPSVQKRIVNFIDISFFLFIVWGFFFFLLIAVAQGFNAADRVSHSIENSGPVLKVLSQVSLFPSELIKASARQEL